MRHVLIARSKRKFIGSGAIGTAPPPASVAVGSLWVDGAVVYQDKYVFDNGGVDTLSLGRPTALVNLLSPTGSDYRVRLVYLRKDTATAQMLLGFGSGSGGTRQCTIGISPASNTINTYIGGSFKAYASWSKVANSWGFIDLSIPASGNGTLTTEAGTKAITARGLGVNAGNINLTSLNDGSDNGEIRLAKVQFFDGANNLIDMFDPNDQNLWDGGLTGTTWSGNPFTITDGSPTGVRVQDWVPINL